MYLATQLSYLDPFSDSNVITKTQKQIQDLENRIDGEHVDGNGTDGEGTNQRHLQTLRVTLNKAFKILDHVDV